jgi:hypothetical protein
VTTAGAIKVDDLSPKLFWGDLWVPDILRTRAQALAGPAERRDVYADVLIAIPVLKNHSNAALTCALKGRVGCAPMAIYGNRSGGTRSIHADAAGRACLDESIVDLNRIRPQDFVVVDALTGHRKGPSLYKLPTLADLRAHIIFPFLFLASRDSVAADVVAANLVGYDPASIGYIALAGLYGLGNCRPRDIRISGTPIGDLRAELADRYGARGKWPFPAGYGTVNRSTLIDDLAAPESVEVIPPEDPVLPGRPAAIRVRARDGATGSGIARIVLLDRGERVGELSMDAAVSAEGDIEWTPAAPGEHLLSAVAVDAFFNQAGSAEVSVTVSAPGPFIRGDVNGDDEVDLSDAVRILIGLFAGVPLSCPDAADIDDTGNVDLADPIGILSFLFLAAPSPPPPFPGCGADPTPDDLACPPADCP